MAPHRQHAQRAGSRLCAGLRCRPLADGNLRIQPLREQVQHYLADIDWRQWAQSEDPYTEIDNAAYKQAVESARRMKAKGYAVEDIAEITGLTAEEIEGL